MVVGIALKLILQPLKVFPSVRNKNSENSKYLEITPSVKAIIESKKTFIKHILSKNVSHKLHKFARKTLDMKKQIISLIKDFSNKNWS